MDAREPAWQRELITSRDAFREALRKAFAHVAATGCKELRLCDEDFAEWPLNDASVIEQLTQWASPHRRLTMIARRYDEVVRRHPRFAEWRRRWSHVVDCRSPDDDVAGEMPVLWVADSLTVRLSDAVQYRVVASADAVDIVQSREAFDALLQRSVAAFAPTILGL